jgi:hypothetical protein
MRAETEEHYLCAWCGESNEALLDVTAGMGQSFVIDCEVCCRPNALCARIDIDAQVVTVEASRES